MWSELQKGSRHNLERHHLELQVRVALSAEVMFSRRKEDMGNTLRGRFETNTIISTVNMYIYHVSC